MTMLEITCRDPIVSRDGRPFGAGQGNRMRSLDWPLPSMLAGSLRTALGKSAKRDFSVEDAQDLLQVEVAGPFPQVDRCLYFPAPQDCVVHPERGALRAAPQSLEAGGGDWPVTGLQPVNLTDEQAHEDFKPEEAPAWWPNDRFAAWLAGDDIVFDESFLRAAEIEQRTHVRIDPDAGAAEESQLFTTAALALTHLRRNREQKGGAGSIISDRTADAAEQHAHPPGYADVVLSARVRADGWCRDVTAKLDALHPLGGERRLAHWKAGAEANAWNCLNKLREAVAAARHIRMVLATPAVFRDGWKPGWLDSNLVGAPPGANATSRLRLVGVSIQRWRAVSGWSLAALPGQPRGPKPVKRMVPAGGVYFFECVDEKSLDLADRWLESVSDDEQDRRDGFGLAAWGVW